MSEYEKYVSRVARAEELYLTSMRWAGTSRTRAERAQTRYDRRVAMFLRRFENAVLRASQAL